MLKGDLVWQARDAVGRRLGLDIPMARVDYLARGLQAAFGATLKRSPQACLEQLATLPEDDPAWLRLVAHLTVCETYFFRDRAYFDVLEQEILPALLTKRRASGHLQVRIWSAGCATGEEAYSLAILLDQLLPDRNQWALTIIGTDVNPQALDAARRGVYSEWALRHTPPAIRRLAFNRREDLFELRPEIRQMVSFSVLNLAGNRYPDLTTNTTAMDLILCRNVLMYFTPSAATAVANRLQHALANGGWLLVAPVEASTELFQPLTRHYSAGTILFRKEVPSFGHAPVPLRLGPPPACPESPATPKVPASARGQAGMTRLGRRVPEAGRSKPERLRSESTTNRLDRAHALADRGQLTEAAALCRAVLESDPLRLEAYLLLAAISQEREDPSAATEALKRALYLAPDCAPAHFALGHLQARQGNLEPARRSMETVASLLSQVPAQQIMPRTGGVTAGRLLAVAQASLQAGRDTQP